MKGKSHILIFICKYLRPRIAGTIFKKKKKVGEITLPDDPYIKTQKSRHEVVLDTGKKREGLVVR
jgi:hypothetical protein